ncbi:hypothetical protein [Kutzneria sp. CA-103260]|uniref:hypothetical protein n=1 Tax=Kutzneria sp. CA-103260 TaxID=2802641 RepID=UPI001BABED7B|nr:hypothetical protein [Kutzneria sp. CA-103260]QUQ65629.1 hypothetical protein JJ691_33530 [Kutzneria sp. CA-103260]
MSQPDLVRPRYREGQQLSVDDLVAEQDHLIATRRRHDITSHSWGIAHGLTLSAQASGLVIAPGYAVDSLGRPLVVPDPLRLRWTDLPSGPDSLDISLQYEEEEVADRVTEGVGVLVVAGGVGPTAAVFLGRLVRSSGTPPYVPAESQLTYLDAEGGSVTAQTGTELALGADPLLSVRIPDDTGTPVQRLAVTAAGRTVVDGTLETPDVNLTEDQALRFGNPVPEPQQAWPWRWYQTELLADGVVTGRQLRVEVGAPKPTDVPDWYRFAVSNGTGLPPLAVDAGGTATVGGDLKVQGPLVLGPLSADPDDPRLNSALLGTWLNAVDQGSRAVDQRFSGDLFDTASLTVTLTALVSPEPPPATQPPATQPATVPPPTTPTFDYAVKIADNSTRQISNTTVVAMTTVNGDRTTEVLLRIPSLAPGASQQLTKSVTLPGAGATVRVEVFALGLLPGGRITLGAADLDWQDTTTIP